MVRVDEFQGLRTRLYQLGKQRFIHQQPEPTYIDDCPASGLVPLTSKSLGCADYRFCAETGEPLRDQAVIDRVAAIREEGADCWFASDPSRFLGPTTTDDYEKVTDILDVV